MSQRKVINIVDKQFDWTTQETLGTKVGSQAYDVLRSKPNGGENVKQGGSCTFSEKFEETIVIGSDPKISFELDVDYKYLVDDVTAFIEENRAGLHSFAGNRAIQTCTITLNGNTPYSTDVNRYIDAIASMIDDETAYGISALAAPDTRYTYNVLGNNNVLQNATNKDRARGIGCTQVKSVVRNTANDGFVVTYLITEKLLATPLQWAVKHGSANPFIGLSTFTATLNISNNLLDSCVASIWDKANGSNFKASIVDSNLKNIELHFQTWSPMSRIAVPTVAYWSCPQFVETVSAPIAVPKVGGVPLKFTSASQQHDTIPKAFVATVKEVDRSYLHPFRTLPVSNLNVTFGSKPNQLMSLEADALYTMSKKNGLQSNRSMYGGGFDRGRTTGCSTIFTASDCSLNDYTQSNLDSSITVKVAATVADYKLVDPDISNGDVEPDYNPMYLSVVSMYDTTLSYVDGKYSQSIAVVQPSEIVSGATMFEDVAYDNHVLGGASMWKKVGHALKKFGKSSFVKAASKDVRENLGLTKGHLAAEIDRAGYGPVQLGGNIITSAGKSISKAEMKRRLNM